MNKFLTSNSTGYRLLRTVAQAVIGVIVANIDVIIGTFSIDDVWKPIIVGVIMAVLSPIMAEIGKGTNTEEQK